MLISKTVIMKWHPSNKKRYEEKGYIYTKMSEEFELKVEDLNKGSNYMVNVKCDCEDCKNPYLKPMQFISYTKYVNSDGKYYCHKCKNKLFGGELNRKVRLKNSDNSFEKWCIKNNRQDILDRWDYNRNNLYPSEISHSSSKEIYFKCPRNIHASELKNISWFTNGQEGSMCCKDCNSFAQCGIDNLGEDFLEKYWDYEKNKVSPWDISKSVKMFVWLKCQNKDKIHHGSYEIKCYSFTNGNRCSYCAGKRFFISIHN